MGERKSRVKSAGLVAALSAAALSTGMPPAAHAEARCPSALTGREVSIGSTPTGFGAVQGLPPLALQKGEYAITIDDGPNPKTTLELSAILRGRCVKGTFFFIGANAEKHPDLVRAVLADGNTIGSHSYSHPDFGKLTADGRIGELRRGAEAVRQAAGAETAANLALVRVPGAGGASPVLPKDLVATLEAAGYSLAGYDASPEDWRNSPPAESMGRLVGRLGDRAVIVLHDGQPNTLALLPMLLDELARRDDRVVSLRR